MAEENDDRTEDATQTRRDDFRKRGQVAQTKELSSALFLMTCAGIVAGLSSYFFQEFSSLFRHNLGVDLIHMIRTDDIFSAVKFAGTKMFMMIAPVLAISFVVGVASTVLQTGLLQIEDAFSFDLEKLNPISGLKRMFSLKSVVEGFKAFLKMLGIGFVVYLLLKNEVRVMPRLMEFSTQEIAAYVGRIVVKLFFGIGIAQAVLAAADYGFQRWDIEKRMMMTKQEIKEEMKNRELDPQIKGRIRRAQREMSNKRMMQKVPTADVIVTNPTHIAIALKYDAKNAAPQMIAKGADLVAERIRALAKEHNIPIVENKPLARTMYKTMKIGQVIPRELYVAVAEVLSYVYKLKRRMKGRI